jgi:hypothetical protein
MGECQKLVLTLWLRLLRKYLSSWGEALSIKWIQINGRNLDF